MAKKLLTHKKAAWQEQFKPQALQGTPLNTNAGVMDWYTAKTERLIAGLVKETDREVRRLFTEFAPQGAAQDASLSSQGRMGFNALRKYFLALCGKKAKKIAAGMILRTDKATSAGLHESLKELSGGLSLKTNVFTPQLKEALKATVNDNVRLIRSIASKHLDKVEGAVMRSIVNGKGLADLVPELEKIGKISKGAARNIARDQTRKATTAFNYHRMQAAGITHFKWLHSGGSQVPRDYHKNFLHGQIFALDDLPIIDQKTMERGLPGQLPHCKCRMVPVIMFDGDKAA